MTKLDDLRSTVVPPVTWETLEDYCRQIFEPIQRGECVTSIWPRMAGRRMWTKFIIENSHLFPQQIEDHNKYLLVYIEPLDLTEQSAIGYLRLIGNSIVDALSKNAKLSTLLTDETSNLFSQNSTDYTKLLNQLKSLLDKITRTHTQLILFLGEFDELEFADTPFYNNLKSLWQNHQPSLHFVFLVMSNIESEAMFFKYRDLIEVIRQNIVFTPLLGDLDSTYVLKNFFAKYKIKDSTELVKLLQSVCGGHPYLLKICTKVASDWFKSGKSLAQLEEHLLTHYEALSVTRTILNSLGPNSKQAVTEIALGEQVDPDQTMAFKLGIIINKAGHYSCFGKLFTQAAQENNKSGTRKNRSTSGKLEFNSATGALTIGGEELDDVFTRQEYELLINLIKEPNKVKSRDEIGTILWGDHSYEKYSDWAIDQIISKLRKKLIKLGLSENIITTLRGRGYKLSP